MNKFTMELVWHNCKTEQPKEFFNNALIITDGNEVRGMSWIGGVYFIEEEEGCIRSINDSVLENWWWADIEQTVQCDPSFNILKHVYRME